MSRKAAECYWYVLVAHHFSGLSARRCEIGIQPICSGTDLTALLALLAQTADGHKQIHRRIAAHHSPVIPKSLSASFCCNRK